MWPFCHLAFTLGAGFQSIFQIWPAATSWSTAAGVPQPFVGAQLWLVAAQSCSQDGCWNAGMCNSATAASKAWSIMLLCRAAELWAGAGLLCEQLTPEGRPRAGHGSASLQGTLVWGVLLGPGWAATSAQPLAHHSCLLSWRGGGAATVSSHHSSKGRSPCMEQEGLSWGGRPVTVVLGELCWRCWFEKAVEGPGRRKEEWGHEMELGGVWGVEEISARGSWGKSWVNRSRPQVLSRGTSTEEKTWLLWAYDVPCRSSVFRVEGAEPLQILQRSGDPWSV